MRYNAYDFFDTVIHRDCHPEEILFSWAKRMSNILEFHVSPSEVYNIRKNVEKKYKIEDSKEELSYQYFLEKIYEELSRRTDMKVECSDFIVKAREIELEIEKKHIFLDEDTINIIRENHSLGNKIILISDFYTDKNFIVEIMKMLNIEKYFNHVFISSEYGLRKSTGNLYRKVLEILNIKAEELTMYGDNIDSDYNIPRRLGIKAIHKKYIDKSKVLSEEELSKVYDDILFRDIVNKPFNVFLADILYFVSNLHRTLVQNKVKRVAFCSREGQLLKVLFDKYQDKYFSEKKIETQYFYVSRKSTLYPSLDSIEKENFDIIFRQYSKMSIENFLVTLKMSEADINIILKELSIEHNIEIERDSEILQKLKNSKTFIELYSKFKVEKDVFAKYVKNYLDEENLHLIDIGWKGTIQDNIQKALPNIKVKGYYFGLIFHKYNVVNKTNKYGIVMRDYPKQSQYFDIVSRNVDFYEDIFVANHGSTIGYMEYNNSVEPVISQDIEEVKIYNYVKDYQRELIIGFDMLLNKYKTVSGLPYEYRVLLMKKILKKTCIYLPQLTTLVKQSQNMRKDNFIVIRSNLSLKDKFNVIKSILKYKRDLYWVDYAYRFFHFKLLAKIYCNLVYKIKYFEMFVIRRKKIEN